MSDGLFGITRPTVSRSEIQARGRQIWRSTYWRSCFRTKTKTLNSVLTEGCRVRRGSSIRISSLNSWPRRTGTRAKLNGNSSIPGCWSAVSRLIDAINTQTPNVSFPDYYETCCDVVFAGYFEPVAAEDRYD